MSTPFIRPAKFLQDLHAVRALVREYIAGLRHEVWPSPEEELASLPGRYAAPAGRFLLACSGPQLIGCIALRPLSTAQAELKRLYIRPAFRRRGLGRKLPWDPALDEILKQAPCRVFLAVSPPIPRQTDEEPPAARTGA